MTDKSTSLGHRPIHWLTLGAVAAGCSSGPTGASTPEAPVAQVAHAIATTHTVAAPAGADGKKPGSATTESRLEWRRAMAKSVPPKEGCYEVSYPSTTRVEVPCTKAPNRPHSPAPPVRGNVAGSTSHLLPTLDDVGGTPTGNLSAFDQLNAITFAEGSFPSVFGVMSEDGEGPFDGASSNCSSGVCEVANAYSLQVNSNSDWYFIPPVCSGGPNTISCSSPHSNCCQGWEQFVYDTTAGSAQDDGPPAISPEIYIQFWIINYAAPPSGVADCPNWGGVQFLNSCTSEPTCTGKDCAGCVNCYANSTATTVPAAPITSLPNLALSGKATSAGDMVTLSIDSIDGDTSYFANTTFSVLGLYYSWTTADFNVYGDSAGDGAFFQNPNTSIVVQTLVDSTPPSTGAPQAEPYTNTGEYNNLTLVDGGSCAFGGSSPGIQFLESYSGEGQFTCQAVPPACGTETNPYIVTSITSKLVQPAYADDWACYTINGNCECGTYSQQETIGTATYYSWVKQGSTTSGQCVITWDQCLVAGLP